jgi:hypothetical protein
MERKAFASTEAMQRLRDPSNTYARHLLHQLTPLLKGDTYTATFLNRIGAWAPDWIEENGGPSHVSLSGGKVYVPAHLEHHLHSFLERDGECANSWVEICTPVVKLFVDVDCAVGPEESKSFDVAKIAAQACLYAYTKLKPLQPDDDNPHTLMVLAAPPTPTKKPGYTKFGIHFHWPYIHVSTTEAKSFVMGLRGLLASKFPIPGLTAEANTTEWLSRIDDAPLRPQTGLRMARQMKASPCKDCMKHKRKGTGAVPDCAACGNRRTIPAHTEDTNDTGRPYRLCHVLCVRSRKIVLDRKLLRRLDHDLVALASVRLPGVQSSNVKVVYGKKNHE